MFLSLILCPSVAFVSGPPRPILLTEGGSVSRTPREGIVLKVRAYDEEVETISTEDGWHVYTLDNSRIKKYFPRTGNSLMQQPFDEDVIGMAFEVCPFAEGAERYTHRCFEIRAGSSADAERDSGGGTYKPHSNRLVAKEPRHQ